MLNTAISPLPNDLQNSSGLKISSNRFTGYSSSHKSPF
jgi:hypothetical protein